MEKKQCLATKAIMESGAQIGYMFREASDFEGDSGWRLFTGEESLDFIDKEDNIEVCDLTEVIKLDASISSYLEMPIGSELERKTGSNEFIKVSED